MRTNQVAGELQTCPSGAARVLLFLLTAVIWVGGWSPPVSSEPGHGELRGKEGTMELRTREDVEDYFAAAASHWRLELALGLTNSLVNDSCKHVESWFCLPGYMAGVFGVGVSPWPGFGVQLHAGAGAFFSDAGATLVGLVLRFRPIQLLNSWGDYAGQSMHALTLGSRIDLLFRDGEPLGDFRGLLGYEYRASFGLLVRYDASIGTAVGEAGKELTLGSTLWVGATF